MMEKRTVLTMVIVKAPVRLMAVDSKLVDLMEFSTTERWKVSVMVVKKEEDSKEGEVEGNADGCCEGESDGVADGCVLDVGELDGSWEGSLEGVPDGIEEGAKFKCRRRLGEPSLRFVSVPLMALAWSVDKTSSGAIPSSNNNAAAPATCGDAIDVPVITLVALLPVRDVDRTSFPGAHISTQLP
jgi:hypothetical protein